MLLFCLQRRILANREKENSLLRFRRPFLTTKSSPLDTDSFLLRCGQLPPYHGQRPPSLRTASSIVTNISLPHHGKLPAVVLVHRVSRFTLNINTKRRRARSHVLRSNEQFVSPRCVRTDRVSTCLVFTDRSHPRVAYEQIASPRCVRTDHARNLFKVPNAYHHRRHLTSSFLRLTPLLATIDFPS